MQLEKFYYDNKIVKAFGYATIIFGIVGMLAGLWVAMQIYYPEISLNLAPTTFGRLRPLHTNADHFCLCRKRYLLRRLLFTAASVQSQDVQ